MHDPHSRSPIGFVNRAACGAGGAQKGWWRSGPVGRCQVRPRLGGICGAACFKAVACVRLHCKSLSLSLSLSLPFSSTLSCLIWIFSLSISLSLCLSLSSSLSLLSRLSLSLSLSLGLLSSIHMASLSLDLLGSCNSFREYSSRLCGVPLCPWLFSAMGVPRWESIIPNLIQLRAPKVPLLWLSPSMSCTVRLNYIYCRMPEI